MAENFWLSDVGISLRVEMLSNLVVTRSFNHALQMHAPTVTMFEYCTMNDASVCADCDSYNGRRFRAGQFMPYLPRHLGCRCFFDVYVTPVKEVQQ